MRKPDDFQEKDSRLLKEAKKDTEAYGKLYQKYGSKVRTYIRRRLGKDPEEAEDLVQDTFVRGYRKLPQFRFRGYSYLTYLLRIAHNLLVNRYRKFKKEISLSDITKEPPEEGVSLAEKMDQEIQTHTVRKEIAKLSQREQEILRRRYEQEIPIKEIARQEGKSENAIKLFLSRVRKRLAKNLTPSEGSGVSTTRTRRKKRKGTL
ncbi:MAG: RNA polymerase sigma factor [Candidatus Yanofskybacteria bacterium]|nr:RNA polymerase sigma factor [Candidatus Yanofskybacteria bacterium]